VPSQTVQAIWGLKLAKHDDLAEHSRCPDIACTAQASGFSQVPRETRQPPTDSPDEALEKMPTEN
jgi:hypothetical protein